MDKRRVSRALAKHFVNPVVEIVAGYVPWWSLLETTGRKSGRPRRNPVGNGLDGDTFWIVAEHGHQAGYVKNVEANPRVRIRVGGRWRTGVAHVLEDDDPRARQRTLRSFNAAFVRLMGTDLLTVRVDLDDPSTGKPAQGAGKSDEETGGAAATERSPVRDGLSAAVPAALLGGIPSTVYALSKGRDPLEATLAAGSLLLPRERRPRRLLLAAIPVHLALSAGWAIVLAAALPRKRPIAECSLAGLAIAGLDLGVVGRRYPRVRELDTLPQVADHLAFGIVTGMVLASRSRGRRRVPASER